MLFSISAALEWRVSIGRSAMARAKAAGVIGLIVSDDMVTVVRQAYR